MNKRPTYKIHGIKRRELKKELSSLKSYVKSFWQYESLDRDMAYDPDDLDNKKRDVWCKKHLDDKMEEIQKIEEILSIKFDREYKLKRILNVN